MEELGIVDDQLVKEFDKFQLIFGTLKMKIQKN